MSDLQYNNQRMFILQSTPILSIPIHHMEAILQKIDLFLVKYFNIQLMDVYIHGQRPRVQFL